MDQSSAKVGGVMRSVPLSRTPSQSRNSPATCQPKHSLTLASKWLPIPTMLRTQKVLSDMKAAESQWFSLPLSCHVQALQQCWRTAAHLVPEMLIRFKAGPRNRSFPGPGLHKHQDSHRCACGFGCGNIPSFSCSGTFTIQSSATNHPVLRVPIVRRCPDNHARQVTFLTALSFFSQASDKPGWALPTTAPAS